MFNSAGEIEKLEQYFAELFRRLGHGAATATGEKFFRMWEEACNPLPFIVRGDGEGKPRREFIDFKTTTGGNRFNNGANGENGANDK